ncbi:MAG: ThiF family adenylyltransferase [Promethearchaeota archaeon]|nr:MAG: ubiquitin-activating enzyme [Helarchaeota virus Nidhogg Meg22_1012]URC17445.1 MAG: ubiquitin-activating enyzme [Helarchaeota virus Nidhogg Meg22_1214]
MNIINTFLRQSGWINPETIQDVSVMMIGCGSVGSIICTMLAKMGVGKFVLFDDDVIEEHNLPNQFFFRDEVDLPKVDALENRIKQVSPGRVEVIKYNELFGKNHVNEFKECDFVVLGVDSMTSRKIVKDVLLKNKRTIIDARTGGLFCAVFYVTPEKIDNWAETLDRKTLDIPCTQQTIIFTLNQVAATACALIFNEIRDNADKNHFRYDYDVENFMVLTS